MATVAQIKRMSEETDKALTDLQDTHPDAFNLIYDYILELKREVTILSEKAEQQTRRADLALRLIDEEVKKQELSLHSIKGFVTGALHG